MDKWFEKKMNKRGGLKHSYSDVVNGEYIESEEEKTKKNCFERLLNKIGLEWN